MAILIAFAVLLAGAVLVLRSAFREETPIQPPETESPPDEVTAAVTVEDSPAETPAPPAVQASPNGDAPAPVAEFDPEATLAAELFAPPPVPLLPAPPGAAPEPASTAPAPVETTLLVRHEHIAITEDRRLDDVLRAAEETVPSARRPALRLFAAITGFALGFAAAMLLVARGIQALFNAFFGG